MLEDKRIRATIISILTDIVLVTLKCWGASLSQSRGLYADALHSMSDIGVSSMVFFSVWLSYRFQRWRKLFEEGSACIIGLIILWVALDVLRAPVITETPDLQQIPWAILLTWACILIAYFVSNYKLRIGLECNAPNLRADGLHTRMDMYSSVAVLIGLIGAWCGIDLDTMASVIVGLFILRIGLVVLAAALQNALHPDGSIGEIVGQWEDLRNWGRFLLNAAERAGIDPSFLPGIIRGVRTALTRYRYRFSAALFILMLILYAASGFYRIHPGESGVVTQFGRLIDDATPPGLHYRLPAPFSRLYRANPDKVFQVEFGFRTIGVRGVATEPEAYLWESQHLSGLYEKKIEEAVLLTGDKNEVDLNLTIEYRLTPNAISRFYFRALYPEAILRALTQQCLQEVTGRMALSAVLTGERNRMENEINIRLQQMLEQLELGIRITATRLQDVHPPVEVVSAFRAVAAAREEMATIVHKAEAYRNETIPKSRGSAAVLRDDAAAYVEEKKKRATGDAAYFLSLADQYSEDKQAVSFLRHIMALESSLQDTRLVLLDAKAARAGGGKALQEYFMGTEFLKWTPPVKGSASPNAVATPVRDIENELLNRTEGKSPLSGDGKAQNVNAAPMNEE